MLEEKYKEMQSDVPESEPNNRQGSEHLAPNQHPPKDASDTSKQNSESLHVKVDP